MGVEPRARGSPGSCGQCHFAGLSGLLPTNAACLLKSSYGHRLKINLKITRVDLGCSFEFKDLHIKGSFSFLFFLIKKLGVFTGESLKQFRLWLQPTCKR